MAEGIALILGGIFCICAGTCDWEFFFSNYKAHHIVNWFGRNGARLFYVVIGVFFAVVGIGSLLCIRIDW